MPWLSDWEQRDKALAVGTGEKLGGQARVLCLCCSVRRLYNGRAKGRQFGSKCNSGDRIGCGIEPVSFDVQTAQIFFTKNGKRVSGKSWVGHKWLEAVQGFMGVIRKSLLAGACLGTRRLSSHLLQSSLRCS